MVRQHRIIGSFSLIHTGNGSTKLSLLGPLLKFDNKKGIIYPWVNKLLGKKIYLENE